jgi:DNA mismatch repair protein MutS2
MDAALELPALVLLDEVGSGTDPIEGGALGAAVIEHFRRRGACLVVTTHDETLKSFATSTDGVEAAAFGFDPDSYKPTYRLRYGVPGRSLALEIAERLGMPASVIADARARRSGRESVLAAHLSKVDKELAALAAERGALARDRDGLAEERQRVLEREARLAEREAVLKRRLDDRLNEKLREARAEVDRVVGELKTKAGALADRTARRSTGAGAVSTGDIGGLRRDAREALDAIGVDAPGLPAGSEPLPPLATPPEPGDTVTLAALGVDAIVRRVNGDKVEVEVRGKRMRVGLDDLRARGSGAPATAATGATRVTTAERTPSAARDLVVIGLTVDEALDRAGKFLDDALVLDERRLRIVHGHGTGRLRESVRAFFRGHPLVSTVARAADNEGGDAATVVELKD